MSDEFMTQSMPMPRARPEPERGVVAPPKPESPAKGQSARQMLLRQEAMKIAARIRKGEAWKWPPGITQRELLNQVVDDKANRLLHVFCFHRQMRQVDLRQLVPADFMRQNFDGNTPMHAAMGDRRFPNTTGSVDLLPRRLVNRDTLSRIRNRRGYAAIHQGACTGSLRRLEPVVLREPSLLDVRTDNALEGRGTVLHLAAREGTLGQVPGKLLTDVRMKAVTGKSETVSQVLANSRKLHLMPAGKKLAPGIKRPEASCSVSEVVPPEPSMF